MEAKLSLWDRLARPIGSALIVLFSVVCVWLTFGFQVAENRASFWDRVLALPTTAENYFFDIRATTQFKTDQREENLVVVKLDEDALEAVGRWPWTRLKVAGLLDRLHSYGARAVALDVIFPEPESDAADGALAASIARFQEGDAGRAVIIGYGLALDVEDGAPEVPVDLGFSVVNGNIGNQTISGFRHVHRQNFVA
ncbi:MAG: CHASE2 domain-containing protein, partial [Bdellovibrionales bacterium]|nr:CHASE2 domain-containing protein [Bdellovibrionales bacterium]